MGYLPRLVVADSAMVSVGGFNLMHAISRTMSLFEEFSDYGVSLS